MIGSSGQKQMTWVLRIGYLYQNELKQYFPFSDTSVELRHFRPPSEVSEHCKLFMLMTPPSSLLGWDQPSRCEKHIKKNVRLKAGWGSSIVCFFSMFEVSPMMFTLSSSSSVIPRFQHVPTNWSQASWNMS